MTPAVGTCPDGPPGLRERKKLATRHALAVAAMRLAVRRGLENVLVDDIAAAAGVSPRTFSNYFTSKYEAICSLAADRGGRIAEALRGRPAGEPIWDSITAVVLAEYAAASTAPDPRWIASWRLVIGSPVLRAEHLKTQAVTQRQLAAAIAARTGADGPGNMFPRILAAAVLAGCQAAMEQWIGAEPPVPLAPVIQAALRQLAEGMRAVIPEDAHVRTAEAAAC
jgi:AcrR family transcriptional regulator